MGLIDFSSTLLSVACSLIIGGALYLYMRRKISTLESLHVEQARLLKSFIAQQQSLIMSGGGGGVVTPAGNVLSSQNEPQSTSVEENPQSRIVVSDNSDSESDYEEDDESSSGVTDSESEYESDTLEDSNIEELSSPTRSPQVSPEPPSEHRTIQLDLGDDFPAPEPEPEVTNLSKMRVDSLRAMALENGVVNSIDEAKKIKKQTLIEMIEAHQNQSETVLSESPSEQTDSSTDKENITAEE
jgi:hypothetical protein